ncbi:MAG: amidase, partial [Nitrospinota bacterium]
MTAPYTLTVTEASQQIQEGVLSPLELVESVFQRITDLEPRLKAWVTLDRDGAIAAAQQATEEAKEGRLRSPLHGIPVGIKDIFYTQGLKTTAGSPVLADFIPPFDATTVARLKAAGAIILGKTTTTEFACFHPTVTRNPWKLNHTPGGSSSGSGAAVAARMCPAALGSQTAGSTLRPAAYCGIVGLKPTYGRISRHGIFPVSWCLDHVGILVRTVQDAALLLQVLAGYDPQDRSSARVPVPPYLAEMKRMEREPRIGLVREFFLERADAAVQKNVEEVVTRLSKAGARIEEVKLPPSFSALHAAHRTIMRVEAAAVHAQLFPGNEEKYSQRMRSLIESGTLVPAVYYLRAQRLRQHFCQEMETLLQQVDVLLTPTTPATAPASLETTGDPAFNAPWTFCGIPAISIP